MIKIEELEKCGWGDVEFIVLQDGRVGEITRLGLILDGIVHSGMHRATFEGLGFQPYRKKQEPLYTFEDAIKNPGKYQAKDLISGFLYRIRVHEYLVVTFESCRQPIGHFLKYQWKKISE